MLADAEARVKDLKVREQFPVGLPWSSAWCPPAAWPWPWSRSSTTHRSQPPRARRLRIQVTPEKQKGIDKKWKSWPSKPRTPEKPGERPKSEDLKRLEARLDEIAKKPRDTTQQLRDRIKDLTPLEEEYKKLERDQTEKARMLQQQFRPKTR